MQLKYRRALRTEGSLVVRTARIAFDVDDLTIDGVNQSCTAYRTVRTDARCRRCVFDAQLLRPRHCRCETDARADQSAQSRSASGSSRKTEKIATGNLHWRLSLLENPILQINCIEVPHI